MKVNILNFYFKKIKKSLIHIPNQTIIFLQYNHY